MISGTPGEIMALLSKIHPELHWIDQQARLHIAVTSKAVYPYQAAVLYHYAKPHNGGRALEIGTSHGYSCFYLASAMPNSDITTLNINQVEVDLAANSLRQFKRVKVINMSSVDYYNSTAAFTGEPVYDFIFVDGDHKRVKLDLPYFNRLVPGGIMLFHDYSPPESTRPCPPVYDAINEIGDRLGRKPDILVVDSDKVGMAGFIKRPIEVL
jgi:predicted O-methyltransferase YrrM